MVLGSKNHHKHVLYTMSKRGFKLGSETRRVRNSKDTPIIRKNLEPGVLGEANMDGSIYISNEIVPGSYQERQVINHEMKHATDIKIGKLEYGDDYVKYNGDTFVRKTINGRDMIHIDGQWQEAGTATFPWEDDANNGTEQIV